MKGSGIFHLALAVALCAAPGARAQLLGNNLAPNVNVINPASAPLPVHDVTAASRQPVTFSLNVGMSWGTQRASCSSYTVPAGTRLEIDHVSAASVVLNQGNTIQGSYTTHSGGNINQFYLDFHDQAFDPTQPLFVADQSQLAFADAASTLQLCAVLKSTQGSGSGGFTALSASFTGYLIPTP